MQRVHNTIMYIGFCLISVSRVTPGPRVDCGLSIKSMKSNIYNVPLKEKFSEAPHTNRLAQIAKS